MDKNRIKALAQHLDCEEKELKASNHNDCSLHHGEKREYLVLTDEEADDRWGEDLDNYIDEVILPEIPEPYQFYFDDEKWKNDAKMDGRGHSLNRYDGGEETEEVDNQIFYIYRQN